jgi:SAM-dependent methyltransferase
VTPSKRRFLHQNSQAFYADALEAAVARATTWLDLGCGHDFLPDFLPRPPIDPGDRLTVGIDLDREALARHPHLRLRLVANIEQLPIASGTFDLVTANMVIEHVAQPAALFREISRVLAPGGSFLFHTPNTHGYTTMAARLIPSRLRPKMANRLQGRDERDVYPTFYRANSLAALRRLAAGSSLEVAQLDTVTSSAQLYQVRGLGPVEERLISLLARKGWERFRPCILGRFVKVAR